MKDKLGIEIQEGDLCLNMAGGYMGLVILIGGFTKGNNPRTVSVFNLRKKWAEPSNLIKATPQQFTSYIAQRVEYCDDRIASLEDDLQLPQDQRQRRNLTDERIRQLIDNQTKQREKLEEDLNTILQMHYDTVAQRQEQQEA